MPETGRPSPEGNQDDFEDSFGFQTPPRSENKVAAFLIRTLLEKRLISEEHLQECLDEREKQDPPTPLAAVLLRKGYLSDEHLEELLHAVAERRRAGGESLTLGESAVKKGLTTSGEVLSALEIQARERQKGAKPRLGEILVRRGTLTISQVRDLLEKQGRRILKCGGCGNQFNVDAYSPEKEYTCLNCGDRLIDAGPTDTLGVEGTATDLGAAIHSLDDIFIGKRIGPCEIIDKVGEGGMGAVYRAKHIALNKTVAIKIMSPAVMGSSHKQRFLREARSAASLEHPNVVVVHDTGEEAGFPYIVMQYIEGKSLGDILEARGKLTPRQALRIMIASASALAAAHSKKLIHRDVKPDNIMITTKGEVKVTDFGLAKSIHKEDMTITAADTVMGTPTYMSPEQFEAKSLDARSDIYSLGVTFYAMLTGVPPFDGDTMLDLWKAHANDPPPPLEEDLPPRIVEITGKMIEKNPKDRYQSAAKLITDLKSVYQELGGEDEEDDFIHLLDTGLVAGMMGKRGKLAKMAVVGALAVALILVLTVFFSGKPAEATHPTAEEMEIFNAARAQAVKLATRKEYIAALDVWDRFGRENPQDFWSSFVKEEREYVLHAANEKLSSMLAEAGKLAGAGSLKLAREKSGEVFALAREILQDYPTPSTERIQRQANQRIAAIDELVAQGTGTLQEVDRQKEAEWEQARKLASQQLESRKFAAARLTCLPFATRGYPTRIRSEAERKLAEIAAEEEMYRAMLAAEEQAEFEQDMLDARNYLELRNYDKARELLGPYLEHDNKVFKKEARQISKEVEAAETFTSAMDEVDRLRGQKDFEKALRICESYAAGGNREWARIAREKRLEVKKERFLGKNLLYIEGGKFTIGSEDPADNNPPREVLLRPYYMGKFEVTNAEYEKFVKATGRKAPDNWPGGKPASNRLSLPVTLVTVTDAAAYCAWLTKQEGINYRLPTEAEWEIAASWDGQKKLTYPWGDEFRKDVCNIDGKLLPVGRCKGDVSPAGAFDMAGNACELTIGVDGSGCVIRGGCCDDAGNRRSARATYRQKCDENTTGLGLGFRVVREDK